MAPSFVYYYGPGLGNSSAKVNSTKDVSIFSLKVYEVFVFKSILSNSRYSCIGGLCIIIICNYKNRFLKHYICRRIFDKHHVSLIPTSYDNNTSFNIYKKPNKLYEDYKIHS